jgi:hypothetical protein
MVPQLPQLATSFCSSTQPWLQHFCMFVVQFVFAPHAPHVVSAARLTQLCAGAVPQAVSPMGQPQLPLTQLPPVGQTAPALAPAPPFAALQPPQFCASLLKLVQNLASPVGGHWLGVMLDESQWQTPPRHLVPLGQKAPPAPAQPPQFSESVFVSVHEPLHMICVPGQPLPESDPDDELEEDPDDVPEEVPDEVPEEVPDDVPEDVPEEVPEDVPPVPDDDPPLPPSAP